MNENEKSLIIDTNKSINSINTNLNLKDSYELDINIDNTQWFDTNNQNYSLY